MPRWDFKCEKCGRIEQDVTSPRCDPEPVWPTCCGQRMEMLYGFKQPISFFEPFETSHFDGKPRTIRTRGELAAMEREFGLQHVDDPNLVADGAGKFVHVSNTKREYFDVGRRR